MNRNEVFEKRPTAARRIEWIKSNAKELKVEEKPCITKLNLIYHVCPLIVNDVWLCNLDQLFRRWHVFTHRRVFAIATGTGLCDPDDTVEEISRRVRADERDKLQFVFVENDRRLREVASFKRLLEAVESVDPNEATFYAHTKGNSTGGNKLAAEYWRNAMYHHLLDQIHVIRDLLTQHPVVGTHKQEWRRGHASPFPTRLSVGNWMFSGTFWWFRNCKVFAKENWSAVPNDRYGAEAWPSILFDASECATVFQPWPVEVFPAGNPYDPNIYMAPIRDWT